MICSYVGLKTAGSTDVISSKFREFQWISIHRFLFIFVAIAAAERSASGSPSLAKVENGKAGT